MGDVHGGIISEGRCGCGRVGELGRGALYRPHLHPRPKREEASDRPVSQSGLTALRGTVPHYGLRPLESRSLYRVTPSAIGSLPDRTRPVLVSPVFMVPGGDIGDVMPGCSVHVTVKDGQAPGRTYGGT